MSCSLELFLNYPCENDFVDRLGIELGVEIADTSCASHPFAGEFKFSATQFFLSRNEVDLCGSGISDDVYQLRIESDIPHLRELDAFLLVYAVLVKTIHADLLVDQSLLVFSSQSSIAKFTSEDGAIVDKLSGERILFVALPAKLEGLLSADLAKLHP